jgi:formylglycine-generating enzyme
MGDASIPHAVSRARLVVGLMLLSLSCGGRLSDRPSGGAPIGEPSNHPSPAGLIDAESSMDSGSSSGSASSGGEASSGPPSSSSSGGTPDGASEVEACPHDSSRSCALGGAGLDDCGSGKENCCASLEVAGGTFYRTYDDVVTGMATLAADGGPTDLADPATVSGYCLDKYLVTVGRFRQFMNAWKSGYAPTAGSGRHGHLNGGMGLVDVGGAAEAGVVYESGWAGSDWNSYVAPAGASLAGQYCTWTVTAGNQENLPINCVNWYEAYAFCIWDGGFLPSLAESEYAAAAGSEQREYPWGSTAPGVDNQYAIYGCYYPNGSRSCAIDTSNIAPVGTPVQGAGLWGQLDLSGDIGEWTLDGSHGYVDPCVDCAYLGTSVYRAFRGGHFAYDMSGLFPAAHNGNTAPQPDNGIGFRCARAP